MEEIEIGGQIMLPVDGAILKVGYVTWQHRARLSPILIEAPNGMVRPLRLIAPRFAPGFKPIPGVDVLEIFRNVQLTQALLDQGFVPPELTPIVEIVENPNVAIRNPPDR